VDKYPKGISECHRTDLKRGNRRSKRKKQDRRRKIEYENATEEPADEILEEATGERAEDRSRKGSGR